MNFDRVLVNHFFCLNLYGKSVIQIKIDQPGFDHFDNLVFCFDFLCVSIQQYLGAQLKRIDVEVDWLHLGNKDLEPVSLFLKFVE